MPVYPSTHMHLYEPSRLVQEAVVLMRQNPDSEHSSTSGNRDTKVIRSYIRREQECTAHLRLKSKAIAKFMLDVRGEGCMDEYNHCEERGTDLWEAGRIETARCPLTTEKIFVFDSFFDAFDCL